MFTPESIFDRFELLLEEERVALRGLDGNRVGAIADEKSALIEQLQQVGLAGRSELSPRLRDLSAGLRRNAVLLAHARDCLRDVLSVIHGAPTGSTKTPSAAPARISLRG